MKYFGSTLASVTHAATCGSRQMSAFTLAEVLVTLGIIGVVAALTIPSLIEKHQKEVTVTKLKVFYTTMSQAFQRAQNDYGSYNDWDGNTFGDSLSSEGDGEKQLQWLEKYLLPYIKYTEKSSKGKYAIVGLANGSGFTNYNDKFFFCTYYSDCKKITETLNTRTRFVFSFKRTSGFEPYSCGWQGTREEFFTRNSCAHMCGNNGNGKGVGLCAKLIQYDGWTIAPDYPW